MATNDSTAKSDPVVLYLPDTLDRPIVTRGDDTLGRGPLADSIARQIAAAPADDSVVLAIVGPWGSGKTSLLALVEESLRSDKTATVMRFNPWLFSGTEQLLRHFFRDLAAHIRNVAKKTKKDKKKTRELAGLLLSYGERLGTLAPLPLVGGTAARIAAGAKFLRSHQRKPSSEIVDQRAKIETLIKTVAGRFVVIIDDLDRLTGDEIRDIVRLVRLVADFPGVAYLLAFDRIRVEQALSSEPGEGRAYLEKIVQVIHDVPLPREGDLERLCLDALNEVVIHRRLGPFDQQNWTNLFHLGVAPLLRTARDVHRLAAALPVTMDVVGQEVRLEDLLAIEALRVLRPSVYLKISADPDSFAPEAIEFARRKDTAYMAQTKAIVEEAVNAGGSGDSTAVRELINRLFPANAASLSGHGQDWLRPWRKERRIANHEVFRFALQKVLPSEITPTPTVEAIIDDFRSGREPTLTELEPVSLEYLLDRLLDYRDDAGDWHLPVTLSALLNQLPRLRERAIGILDDAEVRLRRLVHQLLDVIPSTEQKTKIVRATLPRLKSMSAELVLLVIVGYKQNAGHKHVSEASAKRLERELRKKVLGADAPTLASERLLGELLAFTATTAKAKEEVQSRLDDDAVVVALLRSSLSEKMSQAMGDVAVGIESVLPWEYLTKTYGADLLGERIRQVLAQVDISSLDDRSRDALDAARRAIESQSTS